MAISEDDTDLGWGSTLTGKLADVVDDLLGGGFEPCWDGARVWDGAGRDTLSFAVKTTHVDGVLWLMEEKRMSVLACNLLRDTQFGSGGADLRCGRGLGEENRSLVQWEHSLTRDLSS